MYDFWIPQRSEEGNLEAVLRNLVHHLAVDSSWGMIKDAIQQHKAFPELQPMDVAEILGTIGMNAVPIEADAEQLPQLPYPSLAYVSDKEKTVLTVPLSCTMDEIKYIHPGKGVVKEPMADFLTKWQGVLILVRVNENGTQDCKALADKEALERIERYREKGRFITVDDFLSDMECEYIMALARPVLQRSTITGKEEREESSIRTSSSAFLTMADGKLDRITQRVADELVKLPVDHFEKIQCVYYENGQYYDYHYDTVTTAKFKDDKHTMETCGQRIYTVLIYLNDGFEGGETYFPFLDYRVMPKKGRAAIFQSLTEQEVIIPYARHACLPVTKGVKYACNVWVRTSPAHSA